MQLWSDNVKELLDKMKRQQEEEGKGGQKRANIDIEFEVQKMDSESMIPSSKQGAYVSDVLREDIAKLTGKVDQLTKASRILLILVGISLLLNISQLLF